MKSIKNSLAIFLGVVILISSNGIVLASHSCSVKPGTDVSLFEHKGCCSNGKMNCHADYPGINSLTKKCCQLTITFHKVDVSSSVIKTDFDHVIFLAQDFSTHTLSFSKNYSETHFINKAPPKPAGRKLLTSISLLQI